MNTFSEAMLDFVAKYRVILRQHLSQPKRVIRLRDLGLKDPNLRYNELKLYDIGYKIIEHIREIDKVKSSYYSYSGLECLAENMEKFLSQYKMEIIGNKKIIHTGQLASKYIVKAMQLMQASGSSSTINDIEFEIRHCNEMIAKYSSKEQQELYTKSLGEMSKKCKNEENLYFNTATHFLKCIKKIKSAA